MGKNKIGIVILIIILVLVLITAAVVAFMQFGGSDLLGNINSGKQIECDVEVVSGIVSVIPFQFGGITDATCKETGKSCTPRNQLLVIALEGDVELWDDNGKFATKSFDIGFFDIDAKQTITMKGCVDEGTNEVTVRAFNDEGNSLNEKTVSIR